MKLVLPLVFAAWTVAQAQTTFTNIVFCATNAGQTNFTITIPANTTAEVLNVLGGNTYGLVSRQDLPGDPINSYIALPSSWNSPRNRAIILGPALLNLSGSASGTNWDCNSYLVRFDAVNGTPGAIGAVQMPSTTRAAVLLSSTNLTDWKTEVATTNKTDESYKFYRVEIR